MGLRTVKQFLYASMVDMGGIPIRQPLPSGDTEQIDPFLLIHHHHTTLKAGGNAMQMGVGPHPHRGFSPVTFIFKGDVHHRDSRGNSAIVNAGGVQWMNAGMGIIHSERPSAEFASKGGEQEIIQIWINTPAVNKLDQPAYYSLNKNDIPSIHRDHGKVEIRIVAGEFENTKGFRETQSPLIILEIFMKADGSHKFEIPGHYNLAVYNMDAGIEIENAGTLDPLHLALFGNDGDSIQLKARADSRLLLLAGIPIKEPVQSYGPFVMNNQSQIMQAIRDYQMGKMGVLIEE